MTHETCIEKQMRASSGSMLIKGPDRLVFFARMAACNTRPVTSRRPTSCWTALTSARVKG